MQLNIESKLQEVQKDNRFLVELDFIDPPKSKKELEKVLKKEAIPEELAAFYTLCDGIFIQVETLGWPRSMSYTWELRSADLIMSRETGLGDDLSDLELANKDFIIIDTLSVAGNYVIAYVTEEGILDLHLLTFSKYLNKLNLSFEEYIQQSVQNLGIDLWQQFYTDDPAAISEYYIFDPIYDLFTENKIGNLPKPKLEAAKKACQLQEWRTRHDLGKKLNGKLTFLESKEVSVVQDEVRIAGAPAAHLMKAQELFKGKLSKEMLGFYDQVNGLEIQWEHPENVSGMINLSTIAEMMGGVNHLTLREWGGKDVHEKVIWTGEEKELNYLKQNLLVEKYIGDSGFTSVHIDADGETNVNYVLGRSAIQKTSMSLEEYLDMHIELMGCWHWLSIVGEGKESKVGNDKITDEIKKVFPDFDTDRLLK